MWAIPFVRVGAGNGIRTRDIQLGRLTLYQLSYSRASSPAWWWREKDSNLRRREPADLQSAPFGRSGIPPERFGFRPPSPTTQPCRRELAAGVEPATFRLQGGWSSG